jgi:hypothetical protein
MVVGISGTFWLGKRIFNQLVHDDLYGFLQLGILSLADKLGIKFHFHIWDDSNVFRNPVPIRAPNS